MLAGRRLLSPSVFIRLLSRICLDGFRFPFDRDHLLLFNIPPPFITMRYRLLLPLFGMLLFAFILLNIDIGETVRILSGADILLIFLAAFTALIAVAIKSLKWKMVIGLYDKDYALER